MPVRGRAGPLCCSPSSLPPEGREKRQERAPEGATGLTLPQPRAPRAPHAGGERDIQAAEHLHPAHKELG